MKLTTRTYGIEIEFLPQTNLHMDRSAQMELAARTLRENGIAAYAEGYNHSTRTHWKIITDSSCGFEAVSPVLKGEEGFKQILVVAKTLTDLGFKVDRHCGLHVHHGASDLTPRNFVNIYTQMVKWENAFDSLVAPSRRGGNTFCQRMSTGTISGINQALRNAKNARAIDQIHDTYIAHDRYYKLNFVAYMAHGTIEFRQHQGTLDGEKMIWWIILTQNFLEKNMQTATYNVNASTICIKRFRDMLGSTGNAVEDNDYVRAAAAYTLKRFKEFFPTTSIYEPLLS